MQVSLDQSSPVSSIFNFDPITFELTIKPEIQASLAANSMRLEPGTYKLAFILDSDVLGSNSEEITVEIPDWGGTASSDFVFDFNANFDFSKLETGDIGDSLYPTLFVESIDRQGLVTIGFSDELIVLDDLDQLTARELSIGGELKPNLELIIDPLETQSQSQVEFIWSPLRFTENELLIQLVFRSPFEISQEFDPNTLQIYVWKSSLFTRKSDGVSVKP